MQPSLLDQAVELALGNVTEGQLPFGAVVARGDEVVSTGVNTALRDHDPTAHAEVAAVRAACRELGTLSLDGMTLYSSCEPCPICHTVAVAAGIGKILYAAPKEWVPDLGGPPFPPLLAEVQAAARRLDPDRIEHVPTPGALEPFTAYTGRDS
jgi:guanine deaminase